MPDCARHRPRRGLRQDCNQAFADIEVQLRQRHDLVPNLVETVKGYAGHERRARPSRKLSDSILAHTEPDGISRRSEKSAARETTT